MKKTILLSFFMLVFSGMMYSQFKEFNLVDFKLPDIKRQQLDLNLDLTMNNSFDKYNSNDVITKYNDFLLSNSNRLSYNLYKNTVKKQLGAGLSFNIDPKWTHEKDTYSNYNQFLLNSGFTGWIVNRTYFNNQFFFEPDISISGDYSVQNSKTSDAEKPEKLIAEDISVEIPLLVGKGRIEQVQDARLAIYILEDMQKAGRLARIPETSEILEFASYIASLKNKRYFDYRIRRMEEIEKIDSFMQTRNWIGKADSRYFTTLFDNWEYADGPVRESGKRISAGIAPNFSFSKNQLKNDHDYVPNDYNVLNTRIGMRITGSYLSVKPVGLYWQRGWDANISYNLMKHWHNETIDADKYDYLQHLFSGQAYYSVAYYPNSRTNVNLKAGVNAFMSLSDYTGYFSVDRNKGYSIAPGLQLNTYYYFSAQLRLTAYYYAGYSYSNTDQYYITDDTSFNKSNSFYHYLKIGFTYSFF